MNYFIEHLDGGVVKADGTLSNIMALLGVEVSPLGAVNDGRGQTISAFMIDGKQYSVSDILAAINTRIGALETAQGNYPVEVKITGAGTEESPYQVNYTFDQLKAISNPYMTLNGVSASQISYTVANEAITKIIANFVAFGTDEMTVTTIEITSASITGTAKTYELTEATAGD